MKPLVSILIPLLRACSTFLGCVGRVNASVTRRIEAKNVGSPESAYCWYTMLTRPTELAASFNKCVATAGVPVFILRNLGILK